MKQGFSTSGVVGMNFKKLKKVRIRMIPILLLFAFSGLAQNSFGQTTYTWQGADNAILGCFYKLESNSYYTCSK
jgi:hypothetical protein